jgi:hypothetical protein
MGRVHVEAAERANCGTDNANAVRTGVGGPILWRRSASQIPIFHLRLARAGSRCIDESMLVMQGVAAVRTLATCLVLLIAGLLAAAGCSKKDRYTFFPTHPVVGWERLGGANDVEVAEGYRLLVDGRTQGVFPTSIGVARLAGQGGPTGGGLMLASKPEVDFLAWNSCFDDFRFVSEVFPINAMAMNGAEIAMPSVLENAQAMRAGLVLSYTEEQLVPERYELRGVLYEASSRRPLASLHSVAFIQRPTKQDEHYRGSDPADDLERCDPRIAARRMFEQYARDCLLALAANDEPAETIAPDGWIPDRPIEPIIWPPLDDLRRRYEYQSE